MPRKQEKKTEPEMTVLQSIRRGTAYSGARGFLSIPFILIGLLFVLVAFMAGLSMFRNGNFNGLAMIPFAFSTITALFCFGVVALAGAIFDMADCALNAESRADYSERLKAYQDYQANQSHQDDL